MPPPPYGVKLSSSLCVFYRLHGSVVSQHLGQPTTLSPQALQANMLGVIKPAAAPGELLMDHVVVKVENDLCLKPSSPHTLLAASPQRPTLLHQDPTDAELAKLVDEYENCKYNTWFPALKLFLLSRCCLY